MKSRIIISAAALGWFSLVQAQDSSVPAEQHGAAPLKSAYHDCLLSAGKETFAVLGLDEGQVVRISELQNRYKADRKAAEETEAAETKQGKKSKKVVVKETVVKDAEPPVATLPPAETPAPTDKTGVAEQEPMDQLRTVEQPDPLVMSTDAPLEDPVLAPETTIQTPALAVPSDPAAGDELQGILTAQQWTMWHKQCYRELGETGMIQP